jgi:predicted RNase H-like nuclease (RuvC/YqgF family)
MLLAKVDSMDNSYDKRISNLEALVTPLIAQESGTGALKNMRRELENAIKERPEVLLAVVDERLRGPLSEKERQISLLEKDLAVLKQKECYCSPRAASQKR